MSQPAAPSTVYGPVPSWRFGRSLGVDLLLRTSICSFDCVYCQLGRIREHTIRQHHYVSTDQVRRDLAAVEWDEVDVVTISGNGEPTLALNLGEVIALLKDEYRRPVHVLTNGTWLHDAATRQRLYRADVVACKLDAADDGTLRRVNRPVEEVSLRTIVEGIKALRGDPGFQGKLALQCMFLPGNVQAAPDLAALIRGIGPDEVHLNTPRRPYPRAWYREARGNHGGKAPVPEQLLQTISMEEARKVEAVIKEANPGTPILSIYRDRQGAG